MKKIIAFAGSNSKKSINKQLATYAASLVNNVEVKVLDLNDYQLPIYGIDGETENGIPENASLFLNEIKQADAIIISLAEHNGSYTAVFKNLLDWISRIDKVIFQNKPMLLMTTSPGGRGGKTVFETANAAFPRFGANIVAEFSLPNFFDNFKDGKISEGTFKDQLQEQILKLKTSI